MTPLHYVLLRSVPLLKKAKPLPVWPGPPSLVLMRELLESGASPRVTNNKGQTVRSLAASHLRLETVAAIVAAEVSPPGSR